MSILNYLSENILDERKDSDKVEFVKKWVDNIFDDINSNIKDMFEYYFPKRFTKNVGTRKGRFQKIRTSNFRFGQYISKDNSISISFDRKVDNTLGKYDPKNRTVILYNNSLADWLSRLNDLVYFYNDEEHRENIKNRSKYWEEAVSIYNKIHVYLRDYTDEIKDILFHELIHYFDDLVYSLERSIYIRNDELNNKIKKELGYYISKRIINSSDPEVKDKIDKMVKDVYFNSNEEYNAYYLSAIYKFLTYLNSLNKKDLERAFQYIDGTPVGMMTTFNRFKNRFVLSYLQSFDKFNNIYQRRILKRLYDFYVNIRSVLEAKLKEEKLGG